MKKYIIFAVLLLLPGFFVKAEANVDKLKGRILIQVESHGEAWYVSPVSGYRFYLGRPADAFVVMRSQGLGISNKNFESFRGVAPKNLAGRFLIKVDDKGKAYYVNPVDLKMYYLGKPTDAFNIMKKLGLGISNSALNKTKIDKKSALIIKKEVVKEIVKPVEDVKKEEQEAPIKQEEIVDETKDATTSDEIATTTQNVATSTDCQFLVEYFDNKSLFGSPFSTSTVKQIAVKWGTLAPVGMTRADKFSARFTGKCYFSGGNYLFKTSFDDALKVYVDGENFLQSWADNGKVRKIDRERVVQEGYHDLIVEYYDNSGNAEVSVEWVKVVENTSL